MALDPLEDFDEPAVPLRGVGTKRPEAMLGRAAGRQT